MRPKSDSFLWRQNPDCSERVEIAEEPKTLLFLEHSQIPTSNGVNTAPVDKPCPGFWRGEVMSEKSLPVRVRARQHSPTKRPRSTPTQLPSHQGGLVKPEALLENEKDRGQEVEEHKEESDDNTDCPDTPTPIPRSQLKSAYVPLGAPSPPLFKREQKDDVQIVHTHLRPSNEILGISQVYDLTPGAQQTSAFPFHPEPPSPKVPAYRAPQFLTYTHPPQVSYSLPRRKSLPPLTGRHASVSGRSNVSAGTLASQRSIFSTLGRDELERKKAIVEVDEGPFGRATTMANLREERDKVSKRKSSTRKVNLCGLGSVQCQVM